MRLRTQGAFGTLEQQRRCYWMEEFVLVIEHQQDQLMYQQTVIDEAGAARTPVPQYAQEYRGKPVDLRIGNQPETLAVDEKLCAELADVEANPLGELSLPGINDARKKRAMQLAFMLMVHTKNRAIQMITRLSDPVRVDR